MFPQHRCFGLRQFHSVSIAKVGQEFAEETKIDPSEYQVKRETAFKDKRIMNLKSSKI